MLVHAGTKDGFARDADEGTLASKVRDMLREAVGSEAGEAEVNSWRRSMAFMREVVRDDEIPGSCGGDH